MTKTCEICNKPIPPEYENLLCDDDYQKLEQENARLKAIEDEEKATQAVSETPGTEAKPIEEPTHPAPDPSIKDPNYTENPEADDKEQWMTNLKLFIDSNVLLWHPTKSMYVFIKDYCIQKIIAHPQYPKFIWKPTIVDVGCGIGVGTNILSQEADFVWGIDKNEKSVKFGQAAFERQKNGIYYSSQVSFEVVDIIKDTRTFMKFDIVAAIEIIEHINDYRTFLKNLIIKFDNRRPGVEATEYFISTPNRNNKGIKKEKPGNPYHVREWTSEEMYDALSEYFSNIQLYSAAGVAVGKTTDHTPVLAKCSGPKI